MKHGLASMLLASGALLAACGDSLPPVSSPPSPDVAIKTAPDAPADAHAAAAPGRTIADRYIVRFRAGVPDAATEASTLVAAAGGTLHHTYTAAIQGFAATLPPSALEGLRRNPNVESIEADQVVTLSAVVGQAGATWGLDRIDQRLSRDTLYRYAANGAGVFAYVIDTGILASHADFGGRVEPGATAFADGYGSSDCNGHGTHVAGTVGGATWGVAKGVTLVPVRVLDCSGSGSWSGVIAGLDYVAKDTARRPAVANMSLGGGASASVDAAVAGAVNANVTVVVAAGNSSGNACSYSPAREPKALTVGATGSDDARASYSNFGSCVDLFAPGSGITSSWWTSTAATSTISGTSMAAPHVAGAVALSLQAEPGLTPRQTADRVRGLATAGAILSASIGTGSPNLLLFTNPDGLAKTAFTASVGSLAGSGARSGTGWVATATVTVASADGAAVPGATVTGNFTTGGTGRSCTTDSSGTCRIVSAVLGLKSTSATSFSVTGIARTGLLYDAGFNTPSPATVRIARP